MMAVVVVTGLLLLVLITRYIQRCPHCGSFVRRARRGWVRCRRCGRQYHRSVRGMRSR
jgi:tRNA(Ile2) C34 agmatinyltransferase TiaS